MLTIVAGLYKFLKIKILTIVAGYKVNDYEMK
jgi:hypothetical protein